MRSCWFACVLISGEYDLLHNINWTWTTVCVNNLLLLIISKSERYDDLIIFNNSLKQETLVYASSCSINFKYLHQFYQRISIFAIYLFTVCSDLGSDQIKIQHKCHIHPVWKYNHKTYDSFYIWCIYMHAKLMTSITFMQKRRVTFCCTWYIDIEIHALGTTWDHR